MYEVSSGVPAKQGAMLEATSALIKLDELKEQADIIGDESTKKQIDKAIEGLVAVIDTGADLDHPDIKPYLWVNEAEVKGKPGVDDDGNGYIDDIHGYDFHNETGDLSDEHGHGSNVAGIIGKSNLAKLMILKSGINEKSKKDINEMYKNVFDYAKKHGASVINASYESRFPVRGEWKGIKRFGRPVFVAGGNQYQKTYPFSFPANYLGLDNLFSVGSVDRNRNLSNFTSFSDLYRQGENVKGGGSERSGTSQASPLAVIDYLKAIKEKKLKEDSSRQEILDVLDKRKDYEYLPNYKQRRLDESYQTTDDLRNFSFIPKEADMNKKPANYNKDETLALTESIKRKNRFNDPNSNIMQASLQWDHQMQDSPNIFEQAYDVLKAIFQGASDPSEQIETPVSVTKSKVSGSGLNDYIDMQKRKKRTLDEILEDM